MVKLIFKAFTVLVVIAVFGWTFVFLYQKSHQKPVVFETARAFHTDIVKKAVATGTILPRKEVEIKPQVSGIIDHLYAQAGTMVKKNDLIARIRLTPAMITLNSAESRLEKARITLEDARTTFQREKALFDAATKQGSTLSDSPVFTMARLYAAEARLKQALLALEDARTTDDREKSLYKKSLANDATLQKTAFQHQMAQEQYNEALTQVAMVRQEIEESTRSRFQKAETALKMAEEEKAGAKKNLDLISEGSTEGKVETANTLVRSTIDGMILDLPVKEGKSVVEVSTTSVGTTIAVVADMNDMIFEGNIDESEIGKIKEGMDLILSIAAIEEDKFNAVIEYISPKGVKDKGAVQFAIRAAIQLKAPFFIRSGYSANADVVLDKRVDVLAVDERLLQFHNGDVFVEVETSPQQFVQKAIKVGLSDGINIEVLSGLSGKEKIKIPR